VVSSGAIIPARRAAFDGHVADGHAAIHGKERMASPPYRPRGLAACNAGFSDDSENEILAVTPLGRLPWTRMWSVLERD